MTNKTKEDFDLKKDAEAIFCILSSVQGLFYFLEERDNSNKWQSQDLDEAKLTLVRASYDLEEIYCRACEKVKIMEHVPEEEFVETLQEICRNIMNKSSKTAAARRRLERAWDAELQKFSDEIA